VRLGSKCWQLSMIGAELFDTGMVQMFIFVCSNPVAAPDLLGNATAAPHCRKFVISNDVDRTEEI
jgi:hypothetical protein